MATKQTGKNQKRLITEKEEKHMAVGTFFLYRNPKKDYLHSTDFDLQQFITSDFSSRI